MRNAKKVKMTSSVFKFLGFILIVNYCTTSITALIIPEEFPSLLSLVYSNIPPIKKGSDSRYGIGFRLGEHADFQFLVEVGPQQYTQKLGQNADSSSSAKREVNYDKYKKPTAQTNSQSWLSNWAENMKDSQPEVVSSSPPQVRLKPFINESSLRQLQQLYQPQNNHRVAASVPHQPKPSAFQMLKLPDNRRVLNMDPRQRGKITAELMDVELD